MPRYSERRLHLRDLVPRFEKEPSSTHSRNALEAIGRLRDDGTSFWPEGADEFSRWQRGCDDLYNFISRLGERRNINEQDLPTALREFIQAYEHATGRMFQMLHSRTGISDGDARVEGTTRWCDLVFRLGVYALVSSWIDDKTEERAVAVRMTMNPTTGQTATEVEHRTTKTMSVPRKYRRSTKGI